MTAGSQPEEGKFNIFDINSSSTSIQETLWLCPALNTGREEDKGDLVLFFKELCFLGDLSIQPEKGRRMEEVMSTTLQRRKSPEARIRVGWLGCQLVMSWHDYSTHQVTHTLKHWT